MWPFLFPEEDRRLQARNAPQKGVRQVVGMLAKVTLRVKGKKHQTLTMCQTKTADNG
jgi:hypothetical protein